MKNQERYETVPHKEVIVKDGHITIPSIFMFDRDVLGMKLFIDCCRDMNCTVTFENEKLTVAPQYDSDVNRQVMVYASIIASPKFAFDYIRYLQDANEMSWGKIE